MKHLIGLILFLATTAAQAQFYKQGAYSARALGMGGVHLAFIEGVDAVFYNPAELKQVGAFQMKLLQAEAGVNTNLFDDMGVFGNIDPAVPSSYTDLFGKTMAVQANARTGFAIPKIGIGYRSTANFHTTLRNTNFPYFDTYFVKDDALYLSVAIPITSNTTLGLSGKRVTRWGGLSKQLFILDLMGLSTFEDVGQHFQEKGTGYGADATLMTEFGGAFNPKVILRWEDIGNTPFSNTTVGSPPPSLDQNLTLGTGMTVEGPGLGFSMGLEWHSLTDAELGFEDKIRVGAELSLPLIDVRAGYNRDQVSYGVGVNFLIFSFDAVMYKELIGLISNPVVDDRYMVSLSIDLSFDALFNFTDNNGRKSRLKQRR